MIVEQPEAFKSWLTAVLKPMCDADPAALAKYVIALIKKDKADEELQKCMIAQLEVFLEDETETFVNLVFQTLKSQEYLTTPVIPNANPPNPNIIKKDKEVIKDKMIVQPSELPNLNEQINGSSTAKRELDNKRDKEKKDVKKVEIETREKDDKRTLRTRRSDRSSSRERVRSRSRSWERDRERSPLPHRGPVVCPVEKRERPSRVWRNKSPPTRASRYDRRRSRTPQSPGLKPIRSRSPRSPGKYQHRGNRYRNRSIERSRSRSRSAEKIRRDSAKEKEQSPNGGMDLNHGSESDLRLNNASVGVTSVVTKKRCRDFDEKGYCVRGEMCPFDHGIDPVVLEDTALSRVLNYNPNGAPPDATTNMTMPIIPPAVATAGHPMMGGPRGLIPSEYNPQAPFLRGFRGPRPLGPTRIPPMNMFVPPPNMNRELIPVPIVDNKQQQPNAYTPGYPNQQPYHHHMNSDNDHFYPHKKKFDYSRLGPRAAMKNNMNCSLQLKKIPAGLNSITHLNNHFVKFGKITNIQVNYEGDSEAAIVTFSSRAEASAAFRSTEAVLNNRFIKVFWHNNNDSKQENVPPRSLDENLNQTTPSNANKVLNLLQPKADEQQQLVGSEAAATGDGKQDIEKAAMAALTREETKAQANAAIQKNQELLAAKEKLKKNQDEQRKEVLKIKQDLRKRKQELLEKQLSQQKILIEKMEKLPPGPQRDHVKETIKKTQESIEEIRKDIANSTLAVKAAPTPPQKMSKEDAQKEMLDMELDIIAKQQEGVDTTELHKKLSELKAKTAMFKGVRGGRGRRFNPLQRHLLSKNNLLDHTGVRSATKIDRTNTAGGGIQNSFTKSHSVDHRPTRLLVSGYEIDEQDSVIAHFQKFGEIAEYVTDTSLPSITFNFKVRKDAENALLKGKHFQDRTLSITWCTNAELNNQVNNSRTTRKVLMSESEEDQLIDQSGLEVEEEANTVTQDLSEEILLQDDDEDDDEERSWRR